MTHIRSLKRNTLPMGADRVGRAGALPWYLWVARTAVAVGALDHYPLTERRTRIGREDDGEVELVLPDPAVSRLHVAVTTFPGEDTLWLEDCQSSNGAFVNGRRVEAAAIRAGDVIRLGDSILVAGRGTPSPADEAADLGILGRSPPVVELRSMVRRVAPSALAVLIRGATGTGKELVARALHQESGRRGRVVAVNCAALPGSLVESTLFGHRKGAYTGAVEGQDGAFVQADGGTLFLDEIGDLALEAQPKLLRALEDGEVTPVGATQPLHVSVRVVSATHVPLDAALDEGRFRRDLYARLAGVVVKTPALADRREDVPLLFASFLGEGDPREMSADFVESILLYGWPFNVRELKKLAERLHVLHPGVPCWERGMLDDEMLPAAEEVPTGETQPSRWGLRPQTPAPPPPEGVETHETTPPAPRDAPPAREELIALLEQCEGNVSRVADLVQRNRKQVYRWMKQHAVEPGTGRKE